MKTFECENCDEKTDIKEMVILDDFSFCPTCSFYHLYIKGWDIDGLRKAFQNPKYQSWAMKTFEKK